VSGCILCATLPSRMTNIPCARTHLPRVTRCGFPAQPSPPCLDVDMKSTQRATLRQNCAGRPADALPEGYCGGHPARRIAALVLRCPAVGNMVP